MFRTFYKQCSTEVLLNLYKHLIRPTLEYCCSVWDPSSKLLIVELETTQKLAARICLKDWTSSYAILLKRLNLPTLQSRRTYIKLCMVYRILNEDMYFPPEILCTGTLLFVQKTTIPSNYCHTAQIQHILCVPLLHMQLLYGTPSHPL